MYNSRYYTCEEIDQRLLQGYLDDYNTQNNTQLTKEQYLTMLGAMMGRSDTIDNLITQVGYYTCDTVANAAAKVLSVTNYELMAGGSIKIKFNNSNTADNVTLNINNNGAKPLYYNGELASSSNSWEAGDTVEIYYDGTSYYANNVIGIPGVDEEPTPGSKKLVESGGIAEVYGKYKDYDEWVYILTDKDSKFIFGIKKDGSIEWSVGVPTPIQKLVNSIVIGTDGVNLDGLNKIEAFLNEFSTEDSLKALLDAKVNTEEGKGLIPSQYVEEVDNSEMLQQVLDAAGRVIESTHIDGTKEINWNLKVGGDFETPNRKESTEDSGYVKVLLDANNKLIMGVGGDGDVVFGKVPSQIQRLINEKEDKHEGGDDEPDKNKLMKVVINAMEGHNKGTAFYIRTKYNDEKDIIINHWINYNNLVSFASTYIGPKELEDNAIISATYRVSSHDDSTAPLRGVTQYWHLFAQHGYPVPYIANNIGMTSADVGAEWKDQLDRHFTIGKVTSDYIWLLPVIYKDENNHDVRDWHSRLTSPAITSLIHVSGGSYMNTITVGTNYQDQLRPIMEHYDREWFADGVKLTKPGTYYCDNFKVSDSQLGYDPATVSNWFGSNGYPDLAGAEVMAKFTFSYNYCGAQCCMNTTIDLRREVEFLAYGGTQQQFFVDNGDYKAMFIIPKAGTINGIERDKPFNSPSLNSSNVYVYRSASDLRDINDPVDRMIGYLHNPTTGDYLVGMAAGLSLVSGDTITSKRIQNCIVHSEDNPSTLLSLSPSNTNKFYVSAINKAMFADNDYYWPTNYFKEVNAYISYFDPAENVGQVYWYKDGNNYVIYAHCQSVQDRVAINVPDFMEGLKLTVVEKTGNAQLLTDTIQNGKFFVNYTTNNANYIVLKTN